MTRIVTPFGPIVHHTEQVVAVRQDPARHQDSLALQRVLAEMGRGMWTRDVLRAWAHVLATLPLAASSSNPQGVGAVVLGDVADGDEGPWLAAATALVNTAHARDLDSIEERLDAVFALAPEQMWMLMWRMANQIVPPLGDGGPPAAAAVTAAGAGDTATFRELVTELHVENSPLTRYAQGWAAIAAPACAAADDAIPGEGPLASYLAAVLSGQSTEIAAALVAWLYTSTMRESLDELHALARVVHGVLGAVGGAPRLRASILLHAPGFGHEEALLCRRAAAIVAASATGDRDAMDHFIEATVAAHTTTAIGPIVGVWMDLLAERLHYVQNSRVAVVDPDGIPDGMLSGGLSQLDPADPPQRIMATLVTAAHGLRDGAPGAMDTIADHLARGTDDGVAMVRQLAIVMGSVLRAAETDHAPGPGGDLTEGRTSRP
ncbi:hypothetical protein [Amycolatopsis minnesotensis]|uniref:Uncharacterized protein n=1 Tax=Amycolatopsis minnesotensis TaxID=337894 RepID=A0ABP5DNQ9_9PSEU